MVLNHILIELGASLAGKDQLDNAEDDNEEMSTSGVSTVNSTKLKPSKAENIYTIDEFSKTKVENVRLMQDLLESHKMYQALLRSAIDEQRLNLDLLRNFTAQLTTSTTLFERSMSQGYFSDTSELAANRMHNENLSLSPVPQNSISQVDAVNNNNNNNNNTKTNESNIPRRQCTASTSPSQLKTQDAHNNKTVTIRRLHEGYHDQTTPSIDNRLNEWLIKQHIDTVSKNIILGELFTYDDFVYGIEKSDLHRIGLK